MNQQIKTSLGTIILIIISITIGVFVWKIYSRNPIVIDSPEVKIKTPIIPEKYHTDAVGTACTQEAKLCQDGKTYVSRTGLNCEFAECPESKSKSGMAIKKFSTSSWKVYRNKEYGFEFKYPEYLINKLDGSKDDGWGSWEVPKSGVILNDKIESDEIGVMNKNEDEDVPKRIMVVRGLRIVVTDQRFSIPKEVPIPHDSFIFEESDRMSGSNFIEGYFELGPHAFEGTTVMSKQIYIPSANNTVILSIFESCDDSNESYGMPSPPSEAQEIVEVISNGIISTFKFTK